MSLAGTYARVLADLGEHRDAVFMLGAADAMRERLDHPRSATQTAEIAAPINKTRVALSREEWDAVYSAGRDTSIEDALSFQVALARWASESAVERGLPRRAS